MQPKLKHRRNSSARSWTDEKTPATNPLESPATEELLLSDNLRHHWRGFSFGNYWFVYYFNFSNSSPRVKERRLPV